MDIIEQRTVCGSCGQAYGLFHKDCGGKWITQRRTVTEWRNVRLTFGVRNPESPGKTSTC